MLLRRADEQKPADWQEAKFTYLPSGNHLKPMLLGHDQAYAGWIWVDAMLYFADAYLEGKGYPWLGNIIDIVITLDPKFHSAYEFGAMILSENRQTLPKALEITVRGITQFPEDHKFRVYAGMFQLSLDSNYFLAAEYLKPVNQDQDAPEYMRGLASTLLARAGDRQAALKFLMQSYLAAKSPINREFVLRKMAKTFEFNLDRKAHMAVLIRIMTQVEAEPPFFPLAKTLLSEYLEGNLSQKSQKILDFLAKNKVN
ncbi:hypothetical protein ACFL5V_05310 [Fibrobacterota bacterium]